MGRRRGRRGNFKEELEGMEGVRMHAFENAGHGLHAEEPQRLVDMIAESILEEEE